MLDMNPEIEDIRAFWNNRAGLKQLAGSKDIIAKQLEIMAIKKYIQNGMCILDVGCGNGITAIEITREFDVNLLGIDYAEEMLESARKLATQEALRGKIQFQVGDVRSLAELESIKFDLIYTERVIINLPDWPAQKKAITDICKLLAVGGAYLMLENSQDGLDNINSLRKQIDLTTITPPWHNRYLRDIELSQLHIKDVLLEKKDYYSSTYYFLSRVVNAWIAAQEGKEPEYNAMVNQLALLLPSIGELGQGRIWIWRKSEEKEK